MDEKLKNDIDKVYSIVNELFKNENTGHNISHLKRVLNKML